LGVTNVVGIVADKVNEDVKAQVVRDLIILSAQWDLVVNADPEFADDRMLEKLGIDRSDAPPTIMVIYKAGDKWPETELDCPVVKRDLKPAASAGRLDGDPHVGYYLRPQGRDGANLTEMYLNRAYPKGKGVVNPMISLIWG
jgi:hypothetical protein